jgi:hypothetical protein
MSRKNKKHQAAKEAQEELTEGQLDDVAGGMNPGDGSPVTPTEPMAPDPEKEPVKSDPITEPTRSDPFREWGRRSL